MRLSSILMVCSGLINLGIAIIFYYYVFLYVDDWRYTVGWIMIGAVFTIISIGIFIGSKRLDETKSTVGLAALFIVALFELPFSLPFLFFAFAGEYWSLLEQGIPLLLASLFLLVGSVLKWRGR